MFTPGSRACAYKTASGRGNWPSRDPLGENGGLNLYSILDNDSINEVDYYGLAPTFKLTVSLPQIPLRTVTVFPGFDIDGKIEAQMSLEGTVTCCSGTHKIVKGNLTSKGMAEVGGTFGKRLDYSVHLPLGGFIALQGMIGIRVYAGVMASGQGNFVYDGCRQTFSLSSDLKGGGYVGVEGGVMGNAIVDFAGVNRSYGFGATVYGQGNLNADINVNCDLLGCNVDSSIQGNFEYGFKAKFWRTSLTIKGSSPTHEWTKARNRVDFPWANYFRNY